MLPGQENCMKAIADAEEEENSAEEMFCRDSECDEFLTTMKTIKQVIDDAECILPFAMLADEVKAIKKCDSDSSSSVDEDPDSNSVSSSSVENPDSASVSINPLSWTILFTTTLALAMW